MAPTYRLIFDKNFTRRYKKLDNSIQVEGDKKMLQLKEHPKEIGKPLKYFPNLFELHVKMYRIFYVVQDSKVKVLMIGMEHKDECDKFLRSLTKNKINELLEENP
jgi:mRNA-degrading endonuclease RelE of RelBE toxin-antitoxin system